MNLSGEETLSVCDSIIFDYGVLAVVAWIERTKGIWISTMKEAAVSRGFSRGKALLACWWRDQV